MRIIRKFEQNVETHFDDNREVRFILNEWVQPYDWLMITHSNQQSGNTDATNIDFHSHPNALEAILFQKTGSLKIDGKQHHFEPADIAILEPQDIHGAQNLSEHDCICILIGKGKPQKIAFKVKRRLNM